MTQKIASWLSMGLAVIVALCAIMAVDWVVRDMVFTWALHGLWLSLMRVLEGFVIIAVVIACLFEGDRLETRLWARRDTAAKRAARYMSGYDGQQHKD